MELSPDTPGAVPKVCGQQRTVVVRVAKAWDSPRVETVQDLLISK